MEKMFRSLAMGGAAQPLRSLMWLPGKKGLLGMMPGYDTSVGIMGIKLISVFHGNRDKGYPSHQGVVILFDANNGQPLMIKCPKCGNEFEPNESIRDQIKKELNQKAIEWQKRKDEEFQLKMDEEKKRIQQQLEENIRRSISLDYENQLRLLSQTNKDNEEKLKEARQQQLELFKKEQELKNREAELELSVQKKLQLERERLSVEIRKLEEQRIATIETEYRLRMKEMEERLEAQRKLAEEMKRKAEQGSMQLQGEAQELVLEEMLQTAFPFDLILEVGKGVRGADCIQIVRSNFGQECGKIIYESKRTNAFANEWVEKLKTDMRSQGAEIAVIVTKTMPKDMFPVIDITKCKH